MNFPDVGAEVCFIAGGEATLVTVELNLLVSGLLMSLQLARLGCPVAAVSALPALPVFSPTVEEEQFL